MTVNTDDIRPELEAVIKAAYHISADVGQQVEQTLQLGREDPLCQDEAVRLLTKVITVLRRNAEASGDVAALKTLEGDVSGIVEQIIKGGERIRHNGDYSAMRTQITKPSRLELVAYNGIEPGHVLPTPWFHAREVPMRSGFVKTSAIQLWDANNRLDIHLGQFRRIHGREPHADELLSIMLSQLQLPGVTQGDQFEIVELANSIAVNGVRKPPIVDTDGTLLDGNRRVAACYYILNSDRFDSEQKRRAEYTYVWQITEHATESDREAVVVSLNFESDCKKPWPEYVKARKVYLEWQSMLAAEPRTPSSEHMRKMKRELSLKFALGPDTYTVNRYLKMIDWTNEFEEYQINDRGQDEYKVKHRANEYFQYFDELSKGTKPGSLAYELNQEDAFKHLVFDLLYQGKFKNWVLIRKLRHYDKDVRDALVKAREEADLEEAQELVEAALTDAANRKRESRTVGANARVETFVKWLMDLPIGAFRDEIRPENLRLMLEALRLVAHQAALVLGEKDSKV
jgi:hypothetical protein